MAHTAVSVERDARVFGCTVAQPVHPVATGENYTGLKMAQIGLPQMCTIFWHEHRQMLRFLVWDARTDNYARVKPRNPSTQDWGIERFPDLHICRRMANMGHPAFL